MHNSQKFAEKREAVIVEAGIAECCEIEVGSQKFAGEGMECWIIEMD